MRIKKITCTAISAALMVSSFSIVGVMTNVKSLTASTVDQIITIDPRNTSSFNDGIFEGWGTSLCWYGNRIGYSEKTTKEAAELLYNEKTGLGLNIIRYNIGGGDNPEHDHIQRSDSKMPGYWTNYNSEDGTFDYDFTQDENQRNVLLKSIEECPDMLVEMFSNSPPYFMTNSGCTSGVESGKGDNLSSENMEAFAEYMATVVKHYVVDEGINVVSVEPMNEPDNGWNVSYYGVKQEGCSFAQGDSQSAMLLAMSSAMKEYGLSDITLAGCDETSPSTAYKGLNKLSDEAKATLGRINTHTYSSAGGARLGTAVSELGKDLWMSETDNGGTAGTNAGEMGAALKFATMISSDLNSLQPSAWIMWQAIGSYCDENNEFDSDTLSQQELDTDGFWGVCYADMNEETVVVTKKYYGFGQYTKYIRPGDMLISSENQNTVALDKEGKQLKIVVANTSGSNKTVEYDLSNFKTVGSSVKVIRTSGDMETGENWATLDPISTDGNSFTATLKANSITTFVIDNAVAMSDEEIAAKTSTTATSKVDAKTTSKTNAKTTTKATRSAAQVAKDKAAAKKAMKQAKITKLTVKSKAKKKITVSWKKVKKAKGYQVQVSKKKNFKKNIVNKTTSKKKLTIKNSKLKSKKTYYVRVRAYATYKNANNKAIKVYSSWNKKLRKVKVK